MNFFIYILIIFILLIDTYFFNKTTKAITNLNNKIKELETDNKNIHDYISSIYSELEVK